MRLASRPVGRPPTGYIRGRAETAQRGAKKNCGLRRRAYNGGLLTTSKPARRPGERDVVRRLGDSLGRGPEGRRRGRRPAALGAVPPPTGGPGPPQARRL